MLIPLEARNYSSVSSYNDEILHLTGEMCSACLKHEEHDIVHIHTDAQRLKICWVLQSVLALLNAEWRLSGAASIFTAEMCALKAATEKLIANSRPDSYTIFSHSQKVFVDLQVKHS